MEICSTRLELRFSTLAFVCLAWRVSEVIPLFRSNDFCSLAHWRLKGIKTYVGHTVITLARFNLLRSYYRKGSMAASGKGAGFLESISPWTSRSTTPKPVDGKEQDAEVAKLNNQKGADHSISRLHRLLLKDYPSDCPKANIRWFYATDVSGSP